MKLLIEKTNSSFRKILNANFDSCTIEDWQEVVEVRRDGIFNSDHKLYNIDTGEITDDIDAKQAEEDSMKLEALIQQELREMALKSLKDKGKLDEVRSK